MSLRLYDTLTQQKRPFEPLEAGKVRIYVCGPTVQAVAHLGHARCYVAWDVVTRYLRFAGYEVTHVRNYTDIDDKIIAKANEAGEAPAAFAEKIIAEWEADMHALGVADPDVKPKVTEHVDEIEALIGRLVERGVAYPADGDVYYAVSKFPGYGKLSHRKLDDMRAGARVEPGDLKHDPMDFALWKGAKPGEPSWESPWGQGRPGWHIECSAMSMKYLGESFDIHAGGSDLIFPHHENEIAQSEAATGKPFVRYWLHNGFVNLDGEKMSKSLGNVFIVRELLAHHDAETLRYTLVATHYRSPINFTDQLFDEAKRRVRYSYETLRRVDRALAALGVPEPEATTGTPTEKVLHGPRIAAIRERFVEAMDDDFNTAAALGHLSDAFALMNEVAELAEGGKADAATVAATLRWLHRDVGAVTEVLGLFQKDPERYLADLDAAEAGKKGVDPAEIEGLIAERNQARKDRDFARADAIRDDLAARGVTLRDGPGGTEWTVD